MSLLRFENLQSAYFGAARERAQIEEATRTPATNEGSENTVIAPLESKPTVAEPKISWTTNTPFGKLTVTDATISSGYNALTALAVNAGLELRALKERVGIPAFRDEDAKTLADSGILSDEFWAQVPTSQLMPLGKRSTIAVSGSLTFVPPIASFALIQQSSAFKALLALTVIGGALRPVERVIDCIVDGALEGIFGGQGDIGRPGLSRLLTRALLCGYAAVRSSVAADILGAFVLDLIKGAPRAIYERCAASKEEVVAYGIEDTQLGAVAQWAFGTSTNARLLLLTDKVEVLAAAAVCMFMKSPRLAVVNCATGTCEDLTRATSNSNLATMAVFHGGTAQEAVEILHRSNWLQPVMLAEAKEHKSSEPKMRLACSVVAALAAAKVFIQTAGVPADVAELLVDALKKDAIAKFSRKVELSTEDLPGYSFTSLENRALLYEYTSFEENYQWDKWLGVSPIIARTAVSDQPQGKSQELGASTFYGYTARVLEQHGQIIKLHDDEKRRLPPNTHATNSRISSAVGITAGLIYGLALSCVHCHDHQLYAKMDVMCDLSSDLQTVYESLRSELGSSNKVYRRTCLGVLAKLWLALPALWLDQWPHTVLGISNSHGAVMSAVFGETASLDISTKSFIVSADVPDIVSGDKPVAACGVRPASTVQQRGSAIEDTDEVRIQTKRPYDGCWKICCATVTGTDIPSLGEQSLIHNRVSIVPVCGYISCGVHWWERIDFDDAFAVMCESEDTQGLTRTDCSKCSEEQAAYWLPQEKFLAKTKLGFSCYISSADNSKIVLPAQGNGLMQTFLSGVFRPSTKKLKVLKQNCISHSEANVLIV